MIRAVLDANVLASALIKPEGPPGKILAVLLAEPAFVPIVSRKILDEIRRVLDYPRIKKRAELTDAQCDSFVEMLESIAFIVGDRRGERITADPDDDKYLFAAREGLAEYIVSGDRHLLDLRSHEGILIISPRTFLEILQPGSG